MAKKNRGPPHNESKAEYKYLVLVNPWPRSLDPNIDLYSKHADSYVSCIGAWIRFALDVAPEGVRAVFLCSRREEVVVALSQDVTVDAEKHLGKHEWRRFLKNFEPGVRDDVSYIFEYNYPWRGDPATHDNWVEKYPTTLVPPSTFPVKSVDYPPAIWPPGSQYPRISLESLIKRNLKPRNLPAIFEPPTQSAKVPPTDERIRNTSTLQNSEPGDNAPNRCSPKADTSRYTPYERPAQLLNVTSHRASEKGQPDQGIQQIRGPPLVKKLDPYEEEEAARLLLHSPPTNTDVKAESDSPDLPIKQEPGSDNYTPSTELRDAFALLNQPNKPERVMKPDPDHEQSMRQNADEYRPSANLTSAIEALHSHSPSHDHVTVKQEPYDGRLALGPGSESLEGRSSRTYSPSSTLGRSDGVPEGRQTWNTPIKSEIQDFVFGSTPRGTTANASGRRSPGHSETYTAPRSPGRIPQPYRGQALSAGVHAIKSEPTIGTLPPLPGPSSVMTQDPRKRGLKRPIGDDLGLSGTEGIKKMKSEWD